MRSSTNPAKRPSRNAPAVNPSSSSTKTPVAQLGAERIAELCDPVNYLGSARAMSLQEVAKPRP
jgi:hypothetical protein